MDDLIKTYDFYNQNKYEINIVDPNERILKVTNKQPILTYDKNEIDKNLLNKESIDLLKFNSLELPAEYKKFERIKQSFEKKPKNFIPFER